MRRFWLFCEYEMWLDAHYFWFLSPQRKHCYPKGSKRVLISLTQKYTKKLGPHLVMRGYSIEPDNPQREEKEFA